MRLEVTRNQVLRGKRPPIFTISMRIYCTDQEKNLMAIYHFVPLTFEIGAKANGGQFNFIDLQEGVERSFSGLSGPGLASSFQAEVSTRCQHLAEHLRLAQTYGGSAAYEYDFVFSEPSS